jgi:hypothetical protein
MADIHPELVAARDRAEAAGSQYEAHPTRANALENTAAADALLLVEVQYNHELPWADYSAPPAPEPGPEACI